MRDPAGCAGEEVNAPDFPDPLAGLLARELHDPCARRANRAENERETSE
jgi:hypothetical protein